MVPVQQFPVFRLVSLLLRQLSSPFASRIKEYAKSHPRFRTSMCAGLAHAYSAAEQRFRVGALRLSGAAGLPPRTPPLSDAEAVEIGSNLLGEVLIFVLGALIVVFEVNRQAEKQEVKVLEERSQWVALALALEELRHELELQQAEMERLNAALAALSPAAPPGGHTGRPGPGTAFAPSERTGHLAPGGATKAPSC